MEEKIKRIGIFIFLIALVVFSSGCYLRVKDTWQGSYRPPECVAPLALGCSGDDPRVEYGPVLDSLNECIGWANRKLERVPSGGLIECGRNCRYVEKYREYICKTVDYEITKD